MILYRHIDFEVLPLTIVVYTVMIEIKHHKNNVKYHVDVKSSGEDLQILPGDISQQAVRNRSEQDI